MHVIINHLPLQKGVNWAALTRSFENLEVMLKSGEPEFRGCALVKESDEAATLVVTYATRAALARISHHVAGPWFAEHVRPMLDGPAVRTIGEVVCGSALS